MSTAVTATGEKPLTSAALRELSARSNLQGIVRAVSHYGAIGVFGALIWLVSSTYGVGEAQTLVENCGTTLILRCSASEHGGTSQFASRLIGEREVARRQTSRGRDQEPWFASRGLRRSINVSSRSASLRAVGTPTGPSCMPRKI